MSKKLITDDEFYERLKQYPATAPTGIYILSTDGKLYDPDKWTTGATNAVGVALITDKCRFVIAPDDANKIKWGGYGTLIAGITTVTNVTEAREDFAGLSNTAIIVATFGAVESLMNNVSVPSIVANYTDQPTAVQAGSMKGSLKGETSASTDVVINKPISDAEAENLAGSQSLSVEQQTQLTQYNEAKLKEDFCKKFSITTEAQFVWVINEIRAKLIEMLPYQTEEHKLSEQDIANITDLGIMTYTTKKENSGIMLMSTIENDDDNMYAALWCANYTFKNGKKGYLGAAGEMYALGQNRGAINTALDKINGTSLNKENLYFIWSSTQSSASFACYLNVATNSISTSGVKGNGHYVRPLCPLY